MERISMRPQDLLELYQLVRLYKRSYGDGRAADLGTLLEELEEKYKERTKGEDIRQAGNPRGAGRKRKYTEQENEKILGLYKKGKSLRRISQEVGCSIGHVQDVIKVQK